jgi:shikimate dehydrogenase
MPVSCPSQVPSASPCGAAPPTSVLLGLIGSGIQASRTPAMQEREATEQGLVCIYKLIDLDRLRLGADALPELLTAAERMGFAGLNITHPCKQAVIAHLDELSPNAEALGAVNTVVFRDGRRRGHNTDWFGFKAAFDRDFADAPRRKVVMFGAGGAGVAVAHALMMLGVERLAIVDVEATRAQHLADQMNARHGSGRAVAASDACAEVAAADGVVNATPIGMAHHPGTPFPPDRLEPTMWLADIIYFPMETALLAAARKRGCRTMGGGGMAVFQAVRAFEHFTGRTADAERMCRHFASM